MSTTNTEYHLEGLKYYINFICGKRYTELCRHYHIGITQQILGIMEDISSIHHTLTAVLNYTYISGYSYKTTNVMFIEDDCKDIVNVLKTEYRDELPNFEFIRAEKGIISKLNKLCQVEDEQPQTSYLYMVYDSQVINAVQLTTELETLEQREQSREILIKKSEKRHFVIMLSEPFLLCNSVRNMDEIAAVVTHQIMLYDYNKKEELQRQEEMKPKHNMTLVNNKKKAVIIFLNRIPSEILEICKKKGYVMIDYE